MSVESLISTKKNGEIRGGLYHIKVINNILWHQLYVRAYWIPWQRGVPSVIIPRPQWTSFQHCTRTFGTDNAFLLYMYVIEFCILMVN